VGNVDVEIAVRRNGRAFGKVKISKARSTFDDGANGGVAVYNSATGTFVHTGLSTSGNGPRDPVLSGDGTLLATSCITGPGATCPDPNLNSTHSTLFLQNLLTGTDTGLPFIDPNAGAGGTDEEHACIDADGGLVGADAVDPNAVNPPPNFKSDVYVFDRSAAIAANVGICAQRPQLGVLSVSVLAPCGQNSQPQLECHQRRYFAPRGRKRGLLVLNAGPGLFLPALSIVAWLRA